jgi:hypothetical protein
LSVHIQYVVQDIPLAEDVDEGGIPGELFRGVGSSRFIALELTDGL